MGNDNVITFKCTVNAGDMVHNMAGIKHVCDELGKKAVIYHQLNMGAIYYPGATHPVQDDGGKMVTMNQKQFEMLKPLIEAQPCVESFLEFTGQPVVIDMGRMRGEMNVNMPYGPIQCWPSLVWPDMCPDISKPWIDVETSDILFRVTDGETIKGTTHDKVIINFTDRYRNTNIHYFWLKEFEQHLVFAGTIDEHVSFCSRWKLNMPYLQVDDFLQLAQAIKVCRFFMGNQSMCWGIADAMKTTPRILEYCGWVPNCTWGIGPKSYGFLYQQNVEYYFKRLLKETE